jgi:hypothetical protein
MINKIIALVPILININIFGQTNELEKFREEITLFVNYDQGKIDSLHKSIKTSKRLFKNYQNAFLNFVKNSDSKNLDNLIKNSIDNKTNHIIRNNKYYFRSSRKGPLINGDYYSITIHGLYDYASYSFVSIYIQPVSIDTTKYVIYYCNLNGKGIYHIKELSSNKILFQTEGLTSNAPIKKFTKIDNKHILIIEDMGDNGERALVINTKLYNWKAIKGFYGKAFLDNSTDYSKITKTQKRLYFKFSETGTINARYGKDFLKKYEIDYDETTKTISYKIYNKNASKVKTISAKWENNLFKIDDYFIGQDIDDLGSPISD